MLKEMKTIKCVLSVFVFFLMFEFTGYSQENQTREDVYFEVEELPEFKGGQEALFKFIQTNIVYPEEAKKNGIQGKVFVSFVINESGVVDGAKIERSVNVSIDEEALRIVREMPEWIPGKKDGKPVKVSMTLPIMFALEENNKKDLN